jgi:hypothetical protein
MKVRSVLAALFVAVPLALAGCGAPPAPAPDKRGEAEGNIRQALDQLPREDRVLAEAQKFCAVEGENRLGSMGTPVKVIINDEPVFLCCKNCKKRALQNPGKTLARVKELRDKNAPGD